MREHVTLEYSSLHLSPSANFTVDEETS